MADSHASDYHDPAHAHPGESVYVRMVILLAIITAVEVAIYYVEALESILVPILVVLSVAKFIGVVGWFMHLRYDDRRLTFLFISCLLIAVATVAAVWAMIEFNEFWVGRAIE